MRRQLSLGLVVLLLAGCATPGAATQVPPPVAHHVELTVLAAASLRDALEAAEAAYAAGHTDVGLTVSTDSSAALATQILEGAPADVFLSADEASPARVVEAGLADAEPVRFAGNELAIIVPRGAAVVATPADLGHPGVKVIAAGDDVPITKYATQAVGRLAALDGYPAGFEAAYEANIASREDNVKAVVAKIELGEGDAGIVYVTDAVASEKVDRIEIPAEAQIRATYAGVVLRGSAHVVEARGLLAWLASDRGRGVLDDFGFLPPTT